jgi:hypothetical protein
MSRKPLFLLTLTTKNSYIGVQLLLTSPIIFGGHIMKRQSLFPLCFAAAVLLIAFPACNQSPTSSDKSTTVDSTSSATKAAQAYSEMENQFFIASQTSFNSTRDFDKVDFTNANALFKEALALNPNNSTANLGAGLTEILMALSDTTIRNVIQQWEDSSPTSPSSSVKSDMLRFDIPSGTNDMAVPISTLGKNLMKILQKATTDPPTISKMQQVMKDNFLPRVDYALQRLAVIERDTAFQFKVSGKMQGNMNLSPVYMTLTEVYVMDAMLQGMKAMLEQFLVFSFDLPSYQTHDVVAALQQSNTTFFVLASDGKAHATNAKNAILTMIGKIRSGINFLESQTGSQDNHIIKIRRGSDNGIAQADLDTVLTYLTKVENAFTGTFSFEAKNADSDGNNYTISVSLGKFFDNPPTNPKAQWLPTYTVDTTAHGDIQWHWQGQDYASFNFPDPTFGGVFPGMTNDELKRLLYLDETFSYQLSIYLHDYSNNYNSVSAKVVVNGKTYTPKSSWNWSYYSSYSGEFEFYISDNVGMPVTISAVVNGTDVPLEMSSTPVVKIKSYQYIDVDISHASQSITAQASYGSIQLNLMNWAYYKIERDSTGTGFALYDSTADYGSSYYIDTHVTPGKMYSYRARTYPYVPSYAQQWGDIYATRQNNYTNTVSITAQ